VCCVASRSLAVHVVTFSPKLLQLAQQYTATRTQLVDLIFHYTRLLDAAANTSITKRRWRVRRQQQPAVKPIGNPKW